MIVLHINLGLDAFAKRYCTAARNGDAALIDNQSIS